jgi:hypothetical protein
MKSRQRDDKPNREWPTRPPARSWLPGVRTALIGVAGFLGMLAWLGPVNAQPAGSAGATNSGAVWSWRNPLPTGNSLRGVAYGAGTLVAVGSQGTVVSSPDGMQWTQSISGVTTPLTGVAYGNGLFVAVGGFDTSSESTNTVLTSTNGSAWTRRNGGSTNILWSITYGRGLFVAVGMGDLPGTSVILTSPDGIAWSTRDQGAFGELHSVVYANGLFVAVGVGGSIATSLDGIQWKPQNNGDPVTLNGVAFGKGTFVAVGNGAKVLTSPNAALWTTQYPDIQASCDLQAVTYANGVFATVGRLDVVTGLAATSSDGITWTPRDLGDTDPLYGVVFGQNSFCAVGDFDTLTTSSTGAVWTPRRVGPALTVRDVIFGGGVYVAVGGMSSVSGLPATNTTATVLTSTSGSSWIPLLPNSTATLNGVGYANGTYVAVGESSTIVSSTDAKTWTVRNLEPTAALEAITYAKGLFVAVGDTILTSPDALKWTTRQASGSMRLNAVVYGNGIFAAAGSDNTVMTSPDGIRWIPHALNTFDQINVSAMGFGNGLFVAVGGNPFSANSDGVVFTSPDGVGWTQRDSGFSEALLGVAYVNGTFVATGGGLARPGSILTSTDGIRWTPQESGTLNILYSVRAVNVALMAVGNQGTILQSGMNSPPAPAVRFQTGGIARTANGVVHLSLVTGARGLLAVQSSDDCRIWQSVTNLMVLPDGTYAVTDALPKGVPRRFYRATLTPL